MFMNCEHDPCMYITRFAHRMDFGDKTHEVCVSAMRLVSRMKRDWIHTGRRPSGLCGAALLVAARLHGFTCNLNDVVRVVRIGNDTIRKRLTEFAMTPSSQLTINEFMNIDLEAEADPPAFTESRLKNKQQIENVAEIEEEIGKLSNRIDQEINNSKTKLKPISDSQQVEIYPLPRSSSPSDIPEDPEIQVAANFVHAENPEVVASRMTSHTKSDHLQNSITSIAPSDCSAPSASSLGLNLTEEECFKSPMPPGDVRSEDEEGELDLTGIDDEEIDNLILSEGESVIKSKLWMAENGEFLKEMEIRAEKRRLDEEEREKTKPRKKRKVISRKEYYGESRTAGEAIEKLLHRQKLSNKINYEALKKVTEEPEINQSNTGSKFIESFSSLAKHDEKFNPQVGAEEQISSVTTVTIVENTEVKEDSTKRRKKKIIQPCLNPDVKNEKDIETKVTIETGPVTMAADDETYEEYVEEGSCLSATQLFQHSGHGAYGIDGYDGFDEYE